MSTDRPRNRSSPKKVEEKEEIELSHRDLLVFKAHLCEQAGRFDDMVEVTRELCQAYDDMSIDERNLLSCAYKNVIGVRRTSWRILNEALNNSKQQLSVQSARPSQTISLTSEPSGGHDGPSNSTGEEITTTILIRNTGTKEQETNVIYDPAIIKSLQSIIELELKRHCCNIIEILNNHLIPSPRADGESRVFFYKMKGDYSRYLCEICSPIEQKEKANESLMAYKTACEKATIELPPTHPVRLGLMLNFSVFYYDIMKSPERSCRLAKQAFDDAIAELDTLSEESYRDSTIIMQLLRDNLNLWQSEQEQLANEPATAIATSTATTTTAT